MTEVLQMYQTYFTVFMVIGGSIVTVSRVVNAAIHGHSVNFNTLEFFGYVVSLTYWVVRCTGV